MAVLATAVISCKKNKPGTEAAELKVRLISTSGPSVIKVSPTSETVGVLVLTYSLTSVNRNINLRELPVEFVCSGTTVQIVDHATLRLKESNQVIEDAFPQGNKVLFKNIDIDLLKDVSVIFTVTITLKKSSGNYPEGTTVRASVNVSGIVAEDTNRDVVADQNITGTAEGETFTLLSDGVVVNKISTSTTSEGNTVNVVMVVSVSAFGSTQYLGKKAIIGETIVDTAGFAWVLEDAQAQDVAISSLITATVDVTPTESAAVYKIEDGISKQITITAKITAVPIAGHLYRLRLSAMKLFGNSQQVGPGTVQKLMPFNEYRGEYFRFN